MEKILFTHKLGDMQDVHFRGCLAFVKRSMGCCRKRYRFKKAVAVYLVKEQ